MILQTYLLNRLINKIKKAYAGLSTIGNMQIKKEIKSDTNSLISRGTYRQNSTNRGET